MPHYEYRVVPAPRKPLREKGLRTTEDRFAHALATAMNEMGADGWEYCRAEALPCEERRGLTGRTETVQHVLVFRRALAEGAHDMPQPAPAAPRLVLHGARKDADD